MGAVNSHKKLIFVALLVLFSVLYGVLFVSVDWRNLFHDFMGVRGGGRIISVSGVRLYVDVADDPDEWKIGLSGKDMLPARRGMLFVFPRSDYYGIWMKDMKFPIDVLWIDKDGIIVDVKKHALPDSYPDVYTPEKKAKYVLETISNFVDEHDILIGDKVYNLP